jgi:hypothetical protein
MKLKKSLALLPLVFAVGCCTSTRFTHVDVGSGPLPFVFFDQKTAQMCWAGNETANGKLVPVMIEGPVNNRVVEMPVCKDLK